MNALEALCGALALSTALSMIVSLILAFRIQQWRERYEELIDKPFEFWRQREIARSIMDRGPLPSNPAWPSAEIIEMHLPPQPPAA